MEWVLSEQSHYHLTPLYVVAKSAGSGVSQRWTQNPALLLPVANDPMSLKLGFLTYKEEILYASYFGIS